MSRIRSRLSAGITGILVLLSVAALPLVVPGEAGAATASGTGRYASSVYWLDWSKATGTSGAGNYNRDGGKDRRPWLKVQNGTWVEETPATDFTFTAKFSNVTAGPRTGSSGARDVHVTQQDPKWSELKLNGYDTGNQYSVITPSDNASTVSFQLTLEAKFRGQPIAVDVVATDGESAGHWDKESNVITARTGAPWQNIDNTTRPGAKMWTSSKNNGGFGTQTMGPWYTEWKDDLSVRKGTAPIGVSRGDASGRTIIDVEISASGMQNVMVGVLLPMDFGDAPASYGEAVHLTDWTAVGTNPMLPTGTEGAPGLGFNRAAGNPFLGCVPGDPDHGPLQGWVNPSPWTSDDALGEGNSEFKGTCGLGTADTAIGDDGWTQLTGAPMPPRIVSGNQDYSVTVDAGKADGKTVAAWIDWNNNGTFDSAERAQATVAGGKATLTWTGVAPAKGVTAVGSRFRIAANPAEIALPIGGAASGEVEDHLLPVTPDAGLSKTAVPATGTAVLPGADITYTLALSNAADTEAIVDFTDHLGSVLDDAVLDESSINAPAGITAAFDPTAQTLRLTGTLAAKSQAQVTYRVQVRETAFGDSLLTNTVVQRDNPPPADCLTGNPMCTSHSVTDVLLSKDSMPAPGSAVSPGDTISYTVTAQNLAGPATGVVLTDDLSDVLDDAVFVPGSAQLSVAGAPGVPIADPAADGILTAGPVTLPAGSSADLTYDVRIRDDAWSATLRNVATGSSTESAVRCDVCSTLHSTNAVILVQKIGESADAGWVPMDGSAWSILQDNAGTPGPELTGTPVTPVAGKTGAFRTENLPGGTYWLQETRAPEGFNLLAEPVRFSVAADGSAAILSGPGNGIATVGTEPVSGIPQITIRDVPALEMPESGGRGTAAFLTGGGLLLAAAVLAVLLPRRRQNA